MQDPAHEHFLLQDVESYQFLPLTPSGGSSAAPSPVHDVRHGQGYTKFECSHERLFSRTTFFAARDDAVKLVHVQLRNDGTRTRQLRALAMAEWQMGVGTCRTPHRANLEPRRLAGRHGTTTREPRRFWRLNGLSGAGRPARTGAVDL